jgi:hypothetical protein
MGGGTVKAYERFYEPSLKSFLKRMTCYLAAILFVFTYGRPETALIVLLASSSMRSFH